MRRAAQRLRRYLKLAFLRLTSLSSVAEENYLLLSAIAIGVLAGLGSALFMYSLAAVNRLFFGFATESLWFLGASAVMFLPAIGGLIAGPLIVRFAPEAGGHGVPEVMSAIATRGGRIPGRVAVIKVIASAVTIGSGGSAGQEGPMVQIGAATASAAGRRLGIPPHHMRTFVACGAAGGLSAVFNAPIGGAIFALEVLTGELTPAFGAVILSSVSATVVSRSIFGDYPAFIVPRYDLVSNVELVLYAGLGLVAGLVAAAFIKTLYSLEGRFDGWRFPAYFKPVVGGLMVGIIGRFTPQVLGTGVDAIEEATWGRLAPLLLVVLVPAKILATSLTFASGGSGGVFGPLMYVGSMVGGAFGWVANLLLPTMVAGSGAYALVGIGAVVGGAALAPLSAIILLFEMTDDYRIILPAMVATVVSIMVVRAMIGESIYTLKLQQQNIKYYAGLELQKAHALSVRQAMRTDLEPVPASMNVVAALSRAVRTRARALPVVDDEGNAVGVVSLEQLASASAADERPESVASVMTDVAQARALVTDRLDAVLARLGEAEGEALVVFRDEKTNVPRGVVSRHDVLRVYERVLRAR